MRLHQVRRDPGSDAASPAAPQARASPEAVVSAVLRALSNRDTWQVCVAWFLCAEGCLIRAY